MEETTLSTVIAVTNQKGGVGKTTTSCSLACGLALHHKRVLAVDLDPQGNLGFSLGLEIESGATIYEVFHGTAALQEAIRPSRYCDVISSNILLSGAELEFTGKQRECMLKNILSTVAGYYDYIIIDTPPTLNILTVNAYAAANYLIIPMVPEILSLLGVSQIKETINTVRASVNPDLVVLGILLNKYNPRTLLSREVKEMAQNIAAQIGSIVFNTQIRSSVCVAEAPAQGESLLEYAPRSNPARDYTALVSEVLELIRQKHNTGT
jgi:chromosome partitioning protein